MRWSIITVLSLSLAGLAGLACSKKEPPAPADTEQAAETEPAPAGGISEPAADSAEVPIPKGAAELPEPLKTPAPPVTAPPVIEVLEQGQEPRQALRWNIKPGFEQKLSANVGYTLDAVVVFLRVGEPIYVVSYDLTLRAEKVEDDGRARIAFTVDGANIDMKTVGEKRVSRLKTALTSMRKVTGSYTLGPSGRITGFKMNLPSDARRTSHDMADTLRWALLHMTPTFPEEPLGKGAKWTVHEGIEQAGIHVNQLTTWKVEKLEGTRVELTMEDQQSAAKQSFQDPGLPLTKKLTLLSGTANGPLSWDLTELAPRSADLGAGILKAAEQPRTDDPKQRPLEVLMKVHRALQINKK